MFLRWNWFTLLRTTKGFQSNVLENIASCKIEKTWFSLSFDLVSWLKTEVKSFVILIQNSFSTIMPTPKLCLPFTIFFSTTSYIWLLYSNSFECSQRDFVLISWVEKFKINQLFFVNACNHFPFTSFFTARLCCCNQV